MKGFLYCFRLEIAVVGAYLWENRVRKKKLTVAYCMLNAHCFLLLHSMPSYSPCLFSESCSELTSICLFLSARTFHFTVQGRSILLYLVILLTLSVTSFLS